MSPAFRTSSWLRALAALTAALALACSAGAVEENAVQRGDVAFARDSLEDALAEYRLAAAQGGEPQVLARLAHTYVALGRVREATDAFTRAAERDGRWADMGVADLVRLAREAADRNDHFQMASAMEAARRLRPGLSAPDLTLPLARHYRQNGEYGRAIPLYQRADAEAGGRAPAIVFEIGEAHEHLGDCVSALESFERYLTIAPVRERSQAYWHIGKCSFDLARGIRAAAAGDLAELEEALRLVDQTIEVGEPAPLQAQAWTEKGDILSALGRCDAAVEAFSQVRYYEASTASSWVVNAERRIADIRIGRELLALRGRCG